MNTTLIARGLATAFAATMSTIPPADAADAERVSVFDCGQSLAKDRSRWSPGINVGVPTQMAANCYLVRHAKGPLLWDTGHPDAIAARPDDVTAAGGVAVARRLKTLASMRRLRDLMTQHNAQLRISHDRLRRRLSPDAPEPVQ